jgi:hypothetical protein|uniref:RRM domain-containing protein n=1 Tax=Eutreptiella gymnastica TaxID=73025 RepID=A0A7S4CCW5_9EUGL|eukprot:CAMPEP_0174285298 /NCGR_PEP_ID=MMETSP0809-20121228/8148_1 /TAXON_ID=73025 ORGANISM="Eutreptiella gymnastica-like, Strain CCMP1594" /NCGR_SAMPLE_ID=MMETSP0809 /ASSEMBLY_ACC=CAM_ASM_000658 /LENGTH=334 /DNA_ID=CAMNT_0015381021 /DNA_START=22 /DNA_END=1026 /DNA_ORIENTATION=+
MDTLQQSLEKLNELQATGLIDQVEYNKRKKTLVDSYVLDGVASPAGTAATPGAGSNADGSGGKGKSMGKGKGGGKGDGKGFGGRGAGWGTGWGDNWGDSWGGNGSWGWDAGWEGGKGWGAPGAWTSGYGGGQRYHPYGGGKGGKGNVRLGPAVNVKVQPIPASASKERLSEIFSMYGEVGSAVIVPGEPSYAYINFMTPQAAQAASAMQTVEIDGEWCQVMMAKRRPAPKQTGEVGPSNGIGLFNLPFATTQDELNTLLGSYPGFSTLKMVYDKNNNNKFKGYAFAYFNSVEDATNAKNLLSGLVLGTNNVDVKFSSQSADEAMAAQAQAPATM